MIPGIDYQIFFEKNLVAIFLIYGFCFFYLFLTILFSLKSLKKIGLSAAFSYLMLFALTHTIIEWSDMYLQYAKLVNGQVIGIQFSYVRLALLTISNLFMLAFGIRLNLDTQQISEKTYSAIVGFFPFLLFLFAIIFFWNGLPEINELEIRIRNFLCFPAAIIAGLGFYKLSHHRYENDLPVGYDWNFKKCGHAIIAFGLLAGLITIKGKFLLSPYINSESFIALTGIPVQLLKAMAALFITYFLIRAMALRMSQRLLGTLSAFFVMFFILAFTGYLSINLIGKSYDKNAQLTSHQRDNAYLLRMTDRLTNFLQNSYLAADKRAYKLIVDEYLRSLSIAVDETRLLHNEEVDPKEMEKMNRITLIINRQIGQEDLSISELKEVKTLIYDLVELHQTAMERNKAEIVQDINNFQMLRLVLFFLSVAGFTFIGYTLNKILIRPLHLLKEGTRQIADGNLGHRIHIGTADELQELAIDFNAMSENILDKTVKLEKDAITDGLTGLFNHKFFYNRLESEISRAIRGATKVSILIIDADNFKQYNDKYGHPKGDEVLRRIASSIRESVRSVDIAARYGGEEFAVIMTETGKNGAMVVAEKIRSSIEQQMFQDEGGGTSHNVTVSIGVSTYPDDTKDMNELIKLADDALYTAKREGKNRVCEHSLAQIPVD